MTARVVAAALFFLLAFPAPIDPGYWDDPSGMTMSELYRYKKRLVYHGLQYEVAVTETIDGVKYFYKWQKNGRWILCRFY